MRPPRSLGALSTLALLVAFAALPAPSAYADTTTDTYVVELKPGVSADAVVHKLMGSSAHVVDKVFQGGIVDLNATQAAALATSSLVKSVHKDTIVTASSTQGGAPWDLDVLDSSTAALDGSYTSPNDGSGVSTYVIDSGIQRTHVQFAAATIAAGVNFVANIDPDTSCGAAKIAAGATEDLSVDPANTDDQNGHGTAVSSLIAGATLGASKGVTIVPVRVLDCDGRGYGSDIIRAADWIAKNRAPGSPGVANLSFGLPVADLHGNTSLATALQGLINSGVTVVAAAGNGDANGNGLDACTQSPANLPDAITVAAVNQLHTEASWSNYGSCVDLYAPGELVKVAILGSTVPASRSGTSFSAPLVTAAAAQALHDFPAWSPAQVREDIVARADAGVVVGQGGLPARSPNKLLNVSTQFTGTAPTISGTMYVGETLHANLHWSPTTTSATYQWLRNGQAIVGATSASYVSTIDDLDQNITVAVTGSRARLANISATSDAVVPAVPPDPGMVVTMTPSRLMDTRIGQGATGPLRNAQTVILPVAGVGSIPSTASAVLVNITVTDATTDGFVTAYASGRPMPATSNGNFQIGKASATLALVPLGADGAIALSVELAGSVQLVVDMQSYIAGGVVTGAGAVVTVTPTRLLDTRDPGKAALPAGATLNVTVTDGAMVPLDATAVFVNVTVTEPQNYGYLAVFPSGIAVPATSNLNFVKGLTVPNLALVKVGSDGSISIKNGGLGSAHVIVDIQGYVTAGTPTAAGSVMPVSPIRILDTRPAFGGGGAVTARTGVDVTISGSSVPTGTTGVFMNLTVTEPQIAGWVAAYPTQSSLPLVSNVNFVSGQTVPNLATVGLTDGHATLFNGSFGSVQLIADVFAYIL